MKYVRPLMFVAAVVALLGVQVEQAEATRACCRVFANGVARSFGSFGCNLSGAETRRLGLGIYEVDFTFSADIRGFAKSATLDTQGGGTATGTIGVADRAGDFSSIFVEIRDEAGANVDRGFDACLH